MTDQMNILSQAMIETAKRNREDCEQKIDRAVEQWNEVGVQNKNNIEREFNLLRASIANLEGDIAFESVIQTLHQNDYHVIAVPNDTSLEKIESLSMELNKAGLRGVVVTGGIKILKVE